MRKNHMLYLLLLVVLVVGSLLIACDENANVEEANDDCVGCEDGVFPTSVPGEDTVAGEPPVLDGVDSDPGACPVFNTEETKEASDEEAATE